MNTTEEPSPNENFANNDLQSPSGEPMDATTQFLMDLEDLGRTLGNAVGKLAEDVTGLMVIKVGKDDRLELDVLVDAGAASTRAEAAIKMIRDGIRSNASLFHRAMNTRQQIDNLRNQLRSLRFGEDSG